MIQEFTQWDDGQGCRESEQRLAAISVRQVPDDWRHHQCTQAGDLQWFSGNQTHKNPIELKWT
jgi:hypothetical protein